MSTSEVTGDFQQGQEVRVMWRGQPSRGHVRRVDPNRRNKDGTTGAVLVRVGDGHSQTALFFPRAEVTPV